DGEFAHPLSARDVLPRPFAAVRDLRSDVVREKDLPDSRDHESRKPGAPDSAMAPLVVGGPRAALPPVAPTTERVPEAGLLTGAAADSGGEAGQGAEAAGHRSRVLEADAAHPAPGEGGHDEVVAALGPVLAREVGVAEVHRRVHAGQPVEGLVHQIDAEIHLV